MIIHFKVFINRKTNRKRTRRRLRWNKNKRIRLLKYNMELIYQYCRENQMVRVKMVIRVRGRKEL